MNSNKMFQSGNTPARWTTVAFSGSKVGSTSREFMILITQDGDPQGSTISVLICGMQGPEPKKTLYYKPMSEDTLRETAGVSDGSLLDCIGKLLAKDGIAVLAEMEIGNAGRSLWSWQAMGEFSYESNSNGTRHRAVLTMRHMHEESLVLTYKNPSWSTSTDEDKLRKNWFEKWNKDMAGFTHINFGLNKMGFMQKLTHVSSASPASATVEDTATTSDDDVLADLGF